MNEKSGFYVFLKVVFILVFLPFVLVWGVWKKTTWNNGGKVMATAGIVVVFLFPAFFGENNDSKNKEGEVANLKAQEELLQKQIEDEKQNNLAVSNSQEVADSQIEDIVQEEVEAEKKEEKFKVLSIVDGDTLAVEINGQKEVLRLIGINTPETVDPRKPVECFGKEASNKAKEILSDKVVKLEEDQTQGNTDKYNRLLRYVYLEDGTNFNKLMIEEGYAYEYTYNTPYKYQSDFKLAQQKAEKEKRGLWADDACAGKLTKDVEVKAEETVLKAAPTPAVIAPISTGSSGAYTCNCSKTCPQMGCAEAQYQLNTCGCSRRDADHDGVACDTDCQ